MILSYTQSRIDNVTEVTVTSSLSGTVFYHWFLDGSWMGMTTIPTRVFYMSLGDQGRVEVLDTADPDFDPVANCPAGWPAQRTLWWVRSLDSDVDRYLVQQQKDGGAWTTIAEVFYRAGSWTYQFTTERLDDLSDYAWQIIPVDLAGNQGTALAIAAERIVRTPDAPSFVAAFDPDTSLVTMSDE